MKKLLTIICFILCVLLFLDSHVYSKSVYIKEPTLSDYVDIQINIKDTTLLVEPVKKPDIEKIPLISAKRPKRKRYRAWWLHLPEYKTPPVHKPKDVIIPGMDVGPEFFDRAVKIRKLKKRYGDYVAAFLVWLFY